MPVYQSRHPDVRTYIANFVALLKKEIEKVNLKRVTLVIKSVETGVALERFLIDVAYGEMTVAPGNVRDVG